MSDSTVLEVVLREPGSTNAAKRLRREGMIPAVLYGGDREPRPIAVSPRSVIQILQSESGQNSILSLKVADGPEQAALIHDYQVDPITHRLLHADFKRIDMNVAVEVDVPIEAVGVARGVRAEGGIMDLVVRELSIRCLPGIIPDNFTIDVSNLDINDSLHVRDLEIPEGVEVLTELDATVVTIAPPQEEEELETDAEDLLGEAAEPEVIGKGGSDEDDADEDDDSE